MYSFILFIHVIICVVLLTLVLIQRGKGSDIGASFGAGASNTVFGAAGSTSFLVKLTGLFGILFFATSLALGVMASKMEVKPAATNDVLAAATQASKSAAPAAPVMPALPEGPVPTQK